MNSFPLGGVVHDLRYAARGLISRPGFALIAIATLALGVGANTAIFSVVNAAILTPLPIPAPSRVVMVWEDKVNNEVTGLPASVPDLLDWRASGIFEELAGYDTEGYNLLIGNRPERVSGVAVTNEWFEILRVKPRLGRVIRQEDMATGRDQVVLLTYDLWNSQLNADPAVVGRTILVNGSPRTIIGVLPRRVARVADEELYVPLVFQPPNSTDRTLRWVGTVGRLANNASLALAQSNLNILSARLQKQYPKENGAFTARLQPIEDAYVGDVRGLLWLLAGAVAFVLLIACANVANLLLVRGAARQREMAIRVALGAGRFRLLRQLLTESLLLALLGAAAGIAPAFFAIRFLNKFRPATLPNAGLINLNPTVLLFTLVLAIGTGVLFGIVPAWEAWRNSVVAPLRERAQSSAGRMRFGNLFVVAEIALTVMLVAAAVLMLRSYEKLRSSYPGYNLGVLTMRVSLAGNQYEAPETQILFYKRLLDGLATLPGVRSVGAIDCLPNCTDVIGGALHFSDRPDPPPDDPALVVIGSVTPDYFRAMGIPLRRGRYFSQQDGEHDPLTVIVDEATARQFWSNRDPIGSSIRLRSKWPFRRIVGVVGNIDHTLAVQMKSRIGGVYVPAAQSPFPDMSLAFSSSMSPDGLVQSVRRRFSTLALEQPVFQVRTTGQALEATRMSTEFGTWLLASFALISLALAAIGVYGVVSFTVEQRVHEIGVRMALGATRSDLLFFVLSRGLILIAIGLALGFAGSFVLTLTMRNLLHGITATDPFSLVFTMMLLALTGLLATSLPAYRASRVEPMTALRYE